MGGIEKIIQIDLEYKKYCSVFIITNKVEVDFNIYNITFIIFFKIIVCMF